MVWFKVDDRFHSHPKPAAASLAAIGLWTMAGSWSGEHLQDGFVPDHVIPSLSRGQVELADELVTARLWRRVRGGYRFHEWDADSDGTPRNPTRSEAIAQRSKKAIGGAIGNHRRWHVRQNRTDPACPYCQEEHGRKAIGTPIGNRSDERGDTESPPNPPDPSRPDPTPTDADASIGGPRARAEDTAGPSPAGPEPPSKCPQHLNDPSPPPCGACADARRAHEAWERGRPVEATPTPPPYRPSGGKPDPDRAARHAAAARAALRADHA